MARNSFAVRRIMSDLKELNTDPSDQYWAEPREDDFFDWHFVLRGPPGTAFEGGLYHGRILLPPDYPLKPPNIMFLTQNGRFQIRKKICLSISAYHPEEWQPAWGIRTILEALISFFPTKGEGAVGALDWSAKERKALVPKSLGFCCQVCKKTNAELIPALRCRAVPEDGGGEGETEGEGVGGAAAAATTKKKEKKKKKKKTSYAEQVAQMHFHRATGDVELHTKSERQAQAQERQEAPQPQQQREAREPAPNPGAVSSVPNPSELRRRPAAGAAAPPQAARVNTPQVNAQATPAAAAAAAAVATPTRPQVASATSPTGDSLLLWLAIGVGCFVLMILARKVLRVYSFKSRSF